MNSAHHTMSYSDIICSKDSLNRSLLKAFSLIILTGLLSSCAIQPPTTFDYDTQYQFSRLRTYQWIENEPDKVVTLDNVRQKDAIEVQLNRKGFNRAQTLEQADFLLKMHVVTDKKVDIERFYRGWGYSPFFNPSFYPWPNDSTTIVREYEVGTLVLDIVDPKLKQVIWRGTISKPLGIYRNRTPEERATIAMSNAQFLLASFPPEPIAAPQ